ncbi:MAG: class II fumarate hydratase [Chloroflexi bacterium]|nr:class II fumarate hydratase [Chloroflexota bacterium]
MSQEQKYRTERDSMGEFQVPADAYYGANTMRAVINFPISDLRFPRSFIRALGQIKQAAAEVNLELGLLDAEPASAIAAASQEVIDGGLDDQFVVDIFQTGSGTSTNMNVNEVISNRAIEILGGELGSRTPVHPNDHVNIGQSSNDVIPTAIHVSALKGIHDDLIPALKQLMAGLNAKAKEFMPVVKTGRTHLQDATPVRLGQEFEGHAGQIERGIQRLRHAESELAEVALGGTAVGTGVNTHPEFAGRVCEKLSKMLGVKVYETKNHFQAQSTLDNVVEVSGALKTVAVSLMKISNDIRWLGSGPRGGIGEIELPEVQPGSSIMPGKVNPVIPESVCQVAAQVIGNDATIAIALAAQLAGSVDGEAIRDALVLVASPGGMVVIPGAESVAAGLEATANGDEVNYEGAATTLDWNAAGDVTTGFVGIWQYQDGTIVELEQIAFSLE